MQVHVSLVGRKDLSGEIYRQLRCAILDGRLRSGDPLPPTRELARLLSVSRTTVSVAYDRLLGEGFVSARVGAGTFVNERLATPARDCGNEQPAGLLRARAVWDNIELATAFVRSAEFEFRSGLPDASLFPYEAWRRLLARYFRPNAVGTGVYAHPAGHQGLCDAIARQIGVSRGVQATARMWLSPTARNRRSHLSALRCWRPAITLPSKIRAIFRRAACSNHLDSG